MNDDENEAAHAIARGINLEKQASGVEGVYFAVVFIAVAAGGMWLTDHFDWGGWGNLESIVLGLIVAGKLTLGTKEKIIG